MGINKETNTEVNTKDSNYNGVEELSLVYSSDVDIEDTVMDYEYISSLSTDDVNEVKVVSNEDIVLDMDISLFDEEDKNSNNVEQIKNEAKYSKKEGGMHRVYPYLIGLIVLVGGLSGYQLYRHLTDKGNVDKQMVISQQIAKPKVDKEVEDTMPYLDVDLAPLIEKNEDVVGWIKIGAVGVDIPIVQTTDNEFYLNNDIDKKKSTTGWVFVDTRNNIEHLGTNTVIYGHNVRGRHLGLMKKFLDKNVSSKKGSDIIQFTTRDKQMVFEVVSVYVTHYEDWEYVKGNFQNEQDKVNFANMLKERNTVKDYDRNTLSGLDSYLTFSTCHGAIGTDKRLVVHARMIASRDVVVKK